MLNRKLSLVVATLVVAAGFGLVSATGVVAQTTTTRCGAQGYPDCPAPTSSSQDLGNFRKRQSATFRTGGFEPQSTVSNTFNGTPAGTRPVGTDGIANHEFTVTDVQGVVLGRRTVGLAAIGVDLGTFTQASTSTQVRYNGQTFPATIGRNTIITTGTGSNTAARTFTTTFTIVRGDGGGTTPITGAGILRWSLLALALLGVGVVLILATRRRISAAS